MQENPPVCPAAQIPTHLISYPTLQTPQLVWQKGFSVDKASFWGEFVDFSLHFWNHLPCTKQEHTLIVSHFYGRRWMSL